MKNKILSIFKESIPYIRPLNEYTGSVLSTILMQQLDYWFMRYPDGFYKFLEPCDNNFYKEGESWIEELGFSKEEFRTAFDKIGVRHKSKKSYQNTDNPFIVEGKKIRQEVYYCSYHDKIKGITFYFRNHKKVDEVIENLSLNHCSRKSGTPTYVNQESQSTEIGNDNLRKSGIPTYVNRESQSRYNITEITTEITTDNLFSCPVDTGRVGENIFSKNSEEKNSGKNESQSKTVDAPNNPNPPVPPAPPSPTTIEKLIVLLEAKGVNGQSESYAKEFYYHWEAKEWMVNANGAKMKNVDSYLNKFLQSKEPNKETHPAYKPIVDFFFKHYQEQNKREYKGFAVADGVAINQLIDKLEKEIIEYQKQKGNTLLDVEPTEILRAFEHMLTGHHIDWVKENLSPRILNSKFNDILNSLKNGKSPKSNSNKSKSDAEIMENTINRVRRKYAGTEHAL
jgi:hypothetical protein